MEPGGRVLPPSGTPSRHRAFRDAASRSYDVLAEPDGSGAPQRSSTLSKVMEYVFGW
jgi:hypothetical protein